VFLCWFSHRWRDTSAQGGEVLPGQALMSVCIRSLEPVAVTERCYYCRLKTPGHPPSRGCSGGVEPGVHPGSVVYRMLLRCCRWWGYKP